MACVVFGAILLLPITSVQLFTLTITSWGTAVHRQLYLTSEAFHIHNFPRWGVCCEYDLLQCKALHVTEDETDKKKEDTVLVQCHLVAMIVVRALVGPPVAMLTSQTTYRPAGDLTNVKAMSLAAASTFASFYYIEFRVMNSCESLPERPTSHMLIL